MGSINLQKVKNIHRLKDGKATGEDDICADMLKEEEQETPRFLKHSLQEICDKEEIP